MGIGVPGAPLDLLVVDSAVAIAASVRRREVTAVQIVSEALDRAETSSDLNLFTHLDPTPPLARAAAIDDAITRGEDPGPLAGVPIALKDIIDQAGLPTTAGSSFFSRTAEADAPVVTRLLAHGVVVIGRTGLHEFAYGFSSENEWWGPVRNPWDIGSSAGGSSGGSAAAVAAGVVPIGIGTDTGGSVRVPAALCGLVGLKVTHGRVPLTGVFPLAASLDTVGPMARTVGDVTAAYLAMAGHDPADPWSRDHVVEVPESLDLPDITIGIPHPWVDRAIAPEQHSGFILVRSALTASGATVVDLDLPGIDQSDLARFPGAYHEAADVHRRWFDEDSSRYGDGIRDRLARVLDLTDDEIDSATRWRASVGAAFAAAFRQCDVLLTPATAARSKAIGSDVIDVGAGPEPYRPALSWFTPLVNQAGLPAITLPIEDPGVDGLPPSIQLVGPLWSESRLLAMAGRLDAAGLVARRVPPHVTR